MSFILSLVLYMSDGARQEHPLKQGLTSEYCVDLRDAIRGGVSTMNDKIEKKQLVQIDKKFAQDKNGIKFIDAECKVKRNEI